MLQSRELRVFLSSTFQDLVEEREHLTKKIFPALRAICRERGVEFTEIDLRWGLTDEEAHNGKIIRTCFEEIDACRPYFIGIIGSRYGWVPPYAEIQKDPLLLRHFPWVEDAALESTSILEMEFDYGALRDPSAAEFAFFYLRRDRSLGHRFDDRIEHDNDEKLHRLRQRVQTSGLPFRDFTGPETLGELIHNDLLQIIERNWPLESLTSIAQERYLHEAFSAARRHAYIANPARTRRITKTIRDDKRSVIVVAPSGSGKSALLAYWSHHLRQSDPQQFIIEHYIGVSNDTGNVDGIVLHIIDEIIDRYHLPDELPTKPEEIISQLPFWLARISEPCVIVIDAVNQLDESARLMQWLPELLPENIQFVISTTEHDLAAVLEQRAWSREVLNPLEEHEREAIIVRYLNEYHKSLSLQQSKRIAFDPKCASPLFLRTMLEELRMIGTHKHLDLLIGRYLAAENIDELFQLVLERLEEDFGSRVVRELMSLIWASRNGLSQRELVDLLSITHLRLSSLLLALDYHLQRRGGVLTFFHDYLRHAVEARYLTSAERKHSAHYQIAEYMTRQPISQRRADEEPWQWLAAKEWERLREALFDKDLFTLLSEPFKIHELSRYWRELQQHLPSNSIDDFFYLNLAEDERLTLAVNWAKFLEYYGSYRQAQTIYERVIKARRTQPEQQLALAEALDGISSVYYEEQHLDKAELYLKEAIALKEQLLVREDISSIKSYSNLGAIAYAKGDLDQSISIFQKCVDLCKEYLGATHTETAVNLNNLASLELLRGHNEDALTHLEQSLSIFEKRLGLHHPTVGRIIENIGTADQRLGNHQRAREKFTKALDIFLQAYPNGHLEIAKVKNHLGIAEHNLANYDVALNYFQDALSIRESFLGNQQYETLNTKINIARSLMLKKEYEASIKVLEELSSLIDDRITANAQNLRQNIRNLLEEFGQVGYTTEVLRSLREQFTEAA